MHFLTRDYLADHSLNLSPDIDASFRTLSSQENGALEYLLEASAVYSSNIEGNTMDLNSFMNTKSAAGAKPKEIEEIVV